MKTLVFSDSHLGKNFEERKFKFLTKIITHADRVIINGDFWEGKVISFQNFIYSPWHHLFPLLKKKKAVYIFGNHDNQNLTNAKTYLFSDIQIKRYELKSNGSVFIFEHGNRFFPTLGEKINVKSKTFFDVFENLENFLVRNFNKKVFDFFGREINGIVKKKVGELQPNHYFVCGHTHLAEIDEENRFLNCGLIKHGLGQYLIIEDGLFDLREEWYD